MKLLDYLQDWESINNSNFLRLHQAEMETLLRMELRGKARKSYVERIHAALCEKQRTEQRIVLERFCELTMRERREVVEDVISCCGL